MTEHVLVAMKHVGLNVAADPFINSAIVTIRGALELAVADQLGMHSSQNEQDNRYFADPARIPCLEPAGSGAVSRSTSRPSRRGAPTLRSPSSSRAAHVDRVLVPEDGYPFVERAITAMRPTPPIVEVRLARGRRPCRRVADSARDDRGRHRAGVRGQGPGPRGKGARSCPVT